MELLKGHEPLCCRTIEEPLRKADGDVKYEVLFLRTTGVVIDRTRLNRSRQISFSIGMVCCIGIFYLLDYRVLFGN